MSVWRTFKVAWEGLTLNKVRSFLTTLGVIIGVAAVIVMLAISAGAEAEIADQINALGANLVMVMPSFSKGGFSGPSSGLSYDDVGAIAENVTGINGVSTEQGTTQDISGGGTTLESIEVVGTTAGFPNVREYAVVEGRFLTDEDNDRVNKVVVLGYDIAQEIFGEQSAVGQTIKIGSTKFTVVGVMEEKGMVGDTDYDGRVYIPITVVFKKFASARFGADIVRVIYVSAESEETMDSVISQVTTLRPAGLGGGGLAGGGWHRHHEHHAGQRHRADAGDWPAAGVGRPSPRRTAPVPAGSDGVEPGRWAGRRLCRRGRLLSL
jgi:putative ABC transport system permease protein